MLASTVKRFSIVKTVHEQSVAEHSFNVCMIARAIAKEAGIRDDCRIIKYALDHDLDEIFTGDVPTPAKIRLGLHNDYNGKSHKLCTAAEALIVKLADYIDAIHFIVDNGIGRHGEIVSNDITARYEEYCASWRGIHPEIIQAADVVVEELTAGEYEAERKHV